MIPEVIGLAVLVGWLMRGRFSRLADVQLNHSWLIYAAFGSFFVAQILAKGIDVVAKSSVILIILHTISIGFFLALALTNRRIPGAWLILTGLVLNAVAIAANKGFMPATPGAITAVFGAEYLEKVRSAVHVKHCVAGPDTNLVFLTDIIPLPRPYLLLPGIFSIGDMIMSSGIFIAIISIMRRPLPNEKPVLEEA